jgi:protein-tyrosine-phosphatase
MPRRAAPLPRSVLFCCDQNALRSPMAEGIAKQVVGDAIYVQSAGIRHEAEIDGFAIAVCAEIGVALTRHRVRSMSELVAGGEAVEGFDLIVALSPDAAERIRALHPGGGLEVWDIPAPRIVEGRRDATLDAYRETRDALRARIAARFGG